MSGKIIKPFWMALVLASSCCIGKRLPDALFLRLKGRGVLMGAAALVSEYKSVSDLMSRSHCVSRNESENVARKKMLVVCRELPIKFFGLSGNGS